MRKKLLSRRKKAQSPITAKTEGHILYLESKFDAPRELVYEAYTKAEHLARWWGPAGWTVPVCKVELHPGGSWHYCMESPDGTVKSWGKAIYREINEPEQLVYNDYFSDEEGHIDPEAPGLLITLGFHEEDGATKVVNRAEYASPEALRNSLNMVVAGMNQTWERLADYLQSIQSK